MTLSSLSRRVAKVEAGGFGNGGCPECERAKARLWEAIFSEEKDVSRFCPRCGADVRPTVADADEIMREADERAEG